MNLREHLRSGKTLLLDGAMGTLLEPHGLQGKLDLNLTHPAIVTDIHRQYVRAGSHAVITNTLLLNRIYAASHGAPVDVQAANRAGVRLARSAVSPSTFVLGNIGPIGAFVEPNGKVTQTEATAAFREQAEQLEEEGIDGIIIETMTDLREALAALRACRQVTADLPVLVSLAFETDKQNGRTLMGDFARDCASQLEADGADAVGTNCGMLPPERLATIICAFRKSTSLPLIVEPNAGKPRRQDGKTVFDMDPRTFAQGMLACHRAGATVLGGCCGTTPEHIKAVADLLR